MTQATYSRKRLLQSTIPEGWVHHSHANWELTSWTLSRKFKDWTWHVAFEPSKLILTNILPPARPHLSHVPDQQHQLGPRIQMPETMGDYLTEPPLFCFLLGCSWHGIYVQWKCNFAKHSKTQDGIMMQLRTVSGHLDGCWYVLLSLTSEKSHGFLLWYTALQGL